MRVYHPLLRGIFFIVKTLIAVAAIFSIGLSSYAIYYMSYDMLNYSVYESIGFAIYNMIMVTAFYHMIHFNLFQAD